MTASTDQEGGKAAGWGPISGYVRANLKRLREARGLSTTALSSALEEVGQPIPATGITRVEKGRRRVDADDLVALALVLNTSPLALLLPDSWGDDEVWLTERRRVQSRTAWSWGQGLEPAEDADPEAEDQDAYKVREDFRALALPEERRRAAEHPANREAQDLAEMVARLVQVTGSSVDGESAAVQRALRATRLRLRKLEAELEQIEITAEELDDLSRPDR